MQAAEQLFEKLPCDETGVPIHASNIRDEGLPSTDRHKTGSLWSYSFPYDWREDPLEVAKQLNDYVERVEQLTGHSQVSFICHSMGSVIFSSYLALYGSDDVDTVVFIAPAFQGVSIMGSLLMMIRISPVLVLVFVITIPLSILITRFITKHTNPLFRLRSRKIGELNGFVEEKISGMKTLKAYHQESNVLGDLDTLNGEVVDAYCRSEYYSSIIGPSMGLINNISLSLISVFGGVLYMTGGFSIGGIALAGMTIGGISSFIMYSRKFAGPINEIANIYGELLSALAAADRVFSLLDEPLEAADLPEAEELNDVRGDGVAGPGEVRP